MPENKLTKKESITRFRTSLYRDIVQIVCVNLPFLVIHGFRYVWQRRVHLHCQKWHGNTSFHLKTVHRAYN